MYLQNLYEITGQTGEVIIIKKTGCKIHYEFKGLLIVELRARYQI